MPASSDDHFVEYLPARTNTYTTPEGVMLRFPASGHPGYGISIEEFRDFVRRVRAGAYDGIVGESEPPCPACQRGVGA